MSVVCHMRHVTGMLPVVPTTLLRLLGSRFGASWNLFGPSGGPLLGLLGPAWGLLGACLGPLGGLLGPLGGLLEHSWVPLGLLEADSQIFSFFCRPLGPVLGLSWAVLGASWAVLEPSWAVLGPSWSPLEPSWGRLRCLLGCFGASGS